MEGPIDYFGRMPALDLVGNFARGLRAGDAFHQVTQVRPREEQYQADARAAALQQAQQQALAQQQYQADLERAIANPTGENFRNLILRHPEQHEAIKTGWNAYKEDEQNAIIETSTGVAGALNAGNPELAVKLLKKRKAGLESRGIDTTETDGIIELAESGDPEKIKKARGLAFFALASAYGPDKGPDIIKSLGGGEAKVLGYGDRLVDPTGNVLFAAPDAPFTIGEGQDRYSSGGGSAGGGSAGIDASIVNFFTAKGIRPDVARGIAAGISSESSSNPNAVNPTTGAYGLGQHLGPRKAGLFKRYGTKPTKEQQLEYLYSELKGGDPGGASVLNASDANGAADAYIRNFMRPGKDTEGGVNRALRALGAGNAQPVASKGKTAKEAMPTETRVVAGKAYYKIGGRWFDNAEGK